MLAQPKSKSKVLQFPTIELSKPTAPVERILEYSEFKSDGKRKARKAESIRSYDDFKAISDYLLSRNIRDWALWVIGVSFGVRISDLLLLKVKYLLNEDRSFKKRVFIVEKKTGKLNDMLITESITHALTKYFDSIGWNLAPDDFIFKSQKKGKLTEQSGWRIISNAGKALGLPIVIGSHTMRKSFANIAAYVDRTTIDMNTITKIQGLLNHSDQRTTMQYLDVIKAMHDRARIAVSDFVLGKTAVNELVIGI
jgi:integrase